MTDVTTTRLSTERKQHSIIHGELHLQMASPLSVLFVILFQACNETGHLMVAYTLHHCTGFTLLFSYFIHSLSQTELYLSAQNRLETNTIQISNEWSINQH